MCEGQRSGSHACATSYDGPYNNYTLRVCVHGVSTWGKGTVKETTYANYAYINRKHVSPALGHIKLKNLTPAHVRGFYGEKARTDLSAATVNKMHIVLRKALSQAVSDGLIPRNAADGVTPPRVSAPGEEIKPLDSEECFAFLEAARGERLEALYVLAVHCGLREGELLALRWEDVDLQAHTLQVRRTLTRDGGKLAVGPTKTAKVRRTVKLTQDATEVLQGHLKRQLVEIDIAGDNWQEKGLVFCTGKGTLINPTNLRRRSLAPLLERAYLPPMTFHQLRRTAATILLLKNVNPKVVSEMLGHATIAITLDTYSHVLPNMQHSAVAAMEEAFS